MGPREARPDDWLRRDPPFYLRCLADCAMLTNRPYGYLLK